MKADPYREYRHNQVETATPGKLLLLLYGGALKFIRGAREGIAGKNFEKANGQIQRAQDIIFELMASWISARGR
jgi:flagellar secretion chaperone FliS